MECKVCVFCYKTREKKSGENFTDKSKSEPVIGAVVNRFINVLERLTPSCIQQEDTIVKTANWLKMVGCCKMCDLIVQAFCDYNHQIKCLELKMEWQLQRLVGVMELAGRVPARVSKLRQVFVQREISVESLQVYRKTIIKLCNKRLSTSRPRVLLNRPSSAKKLTRDIGDNSSGAYCTSNDFPEIDTNDIAETGDITSECMEERQTPNFDDPTMISNDDSDILKDKPSIPSNSEFVNDNFQSDEEPASASSNKLSKKKSHPKKFECTECGKKFQRKQILNNHMLTHQKGNLPCEICNRTYPHSLALKKHMRIMHTEKATAVKKPLKPNKLASPICDFCGAKFPSRQLLGIHVRIDHVNKGDVGNQKLLQCSQCDRKFLTKTVLQQHTNRVHTSAKFSCSKCEKSFKILSCLRLHESTHQEKEIQCTECGKMFFNKADLRQHVIKHDKTKASIICQFCGKTFPNRMTIRDHLRWVHKDKGKTSLHLPELLYGMEEEDNVVTPGFLEAVEKALPDDSQMGSNIEDDLSKETKREMKDIVEKRKTEEMSDGLNSPDLEIHARVKSEME